MKRPLILFVCTGNICRSPMAEGLLCKRLGSATPWTVASAGLMASPGCPASEEAVTALREIGVDMTNHGARLLTADLANEAALIVVMTAAHKDQLTSRFPAAREKTFLFKSFSDDRGGDVPDPIGMPLAIYRQLRDEMNEAMPEIEGFLNSLDVN